MTKQTEYKSIRKETQAMIDSPEGIDIDFKESPAGVKAEDFVAFANTNGGTILVGVKEIKSSSGELERGEIVGCTISDEKKQAFIHAASTCLPSITITVTVENSKTTNPIYRIDIPVGKDKPYCTSGGVYKYRAEGQRITIDPSYMRSVILEVESERFIARFKSAAEGILSQIDKVKRQLSNQIDRVEELLQEVKYAAEEARDAAQEATNAAEDAVNAVENIGNDGDR